MAKMENNTETETVRAIWADDYGAPEQVLKVKEIPKPTVSDGKLLVRVLATSTHAGDWHLVRGTPYLIRLIFGGIRKPKIHIPGCEMCGRIEQLPDSNSEFSVGDIVFGDLSGSGFGSFSEYVTVPAHAVVRKPDHVPISHAAACATSALAALQAVRDYANVSSTSTVLVNGASGGVGHYAVQIAKNLGAHVTAVCQTRKMDTVRQFGADDVIDYTENDIIQMGVKYDVVIDAAAFRSPFDYVRILNKGGKYIMVGGDTGRFFQMMYAGPWISMSSGVSAKFFESKPNQKDLATLRDMLDDGSLVPHIDKTFSFEETPQAVAYVEQRKVTGKVVIQVERA